MVFKVIFVTAFAGAAATASARSLKCVASTWASLSAALTKSVAPDDEGGNAPPQSLTGSHFVDPSLSRPLEHATSARMGVQPQPDGSFANPAAHSVTPTGTHSIEPICANVPAAHASFGSTGAHPAPSGSSPNPSAHADAGATLVSGAPTLGGSSSAPQPTRPSRKSDVIPDKVDRTRGL